MKITCGETYTCENGFTVKVKKSSLPYYKFKVDEAYDEQGVPLCSCNDKLFLNISESRIGEFPESYTVSMVHENGYGEWCDFKIYSLTEEQITKFLGQYESRMKKLWEVFTEGY